MYLNQKIEKLATKSTGSNQVIGTFLLKNVKQVGALSMGEVAAKTFTSKATLSRFAKKLGYSGWTEFLFAYTHETASTENAATEIDFNLPFSANDATLTIIDRMMAVKKQSLDQTAQLLDTVTLTAAAKRIQQSRQIVLFGGSPNLYYAESFRRNLLSISHPATVVRVDEAGMTVAAMQPQDCAVIISYAGNNAAVYPMSVVPTLLKKQIPIISITSGGDNYLRKYSELTLNIPSNEKLYSKITNFASEEAMMFLLSCLFSSVFALNYQDNLAQKIDYAKNIEANRLAAFAAVNE